MLWTWTWKTTHLYFTHWHCHWVRSYKFSPPFNTTLWSDKIKKDLADCFLLWKPFRSNEIAFKRIPYHAHLLNLHETTSAKCSQTSRSRLHRSFPILGPSITVTSCFWRLPKTRFLLSDSLADIEALKRAAVSVWMSPPPARPHLTSSGQVNRQVFVMYTEYRLRIMIIIQARGHYGTQKHTKPVFRFKDTCR